MKHQQPVCSFFIYDRESHRIYQTSIDGDVSSLVINGITEQDAGTYVCEATITSTGEITSNQVVLDVRGISLFPALLNE